MRCLGSSDGFLCCSGSVSSSRLLINFIQMKDKIQLFHPLKHRIYLWLKVQLKENLYLTNIKNYIRVYC